MPLFFYAKKGGTMSDYNFVAKIQADLDMSNADSQLNSFIQKCESQKIKLTIDPNSFSNVDYNKLGSIAGKQFSKGLSSNIKSTTSSSGVTSIFNPKELQKQGKIYFSKVTNTVDKMVPTINKKFENLGFTDINVKGIEKANGQIKSFTVTARDSSKALKEFNFQRAKLDFPNRSRTGFVESDNVKIRETSATAQAKVIERQNKELEKVIRQREELVNKYNTAQSKLNDFSSTLSGSKSLYENTNQYTRAKSYMENAQSISEKISSEISKGDNANFDKITTDLREMTTAANKAYSEFNRLEQPINAVMAVKASNSTLSWLENNSKAAKEYGAALEDLADKQRKATTQGELTDLQNQFNIVTGKARSKGLTGASWTDDLKRATGQIAQFAGVYGAIQNVVFEVPAQAINAVKDINSAQIELSKVSDASTSQLSNYWDEAAESAKKYGSTISDVIESTADWSRLGYNLEDSKQLSDATTLLNKVGDNMTQESSSEGLISTLKGFQLEADQAESIVDKVNEVANTQPIDTAGLFAGLQRSASSMDAANNTLEETIALITAANTVVQDPDTVGTAFKTISMRIRGATTELEEAGLETDGMASSTAKLREEILALGGVDIMENDTTFKSTYDILDELSNKWAELTDIQQASIIELIAGKRQGNIVSSLMTNFDIARESLETAEYGSEGSAQRELENWNKGIEASLSHFQAQFQEFSTSLISSDLFKGLVDGATTLLSLLTEIIDKIGLIPLALGGAGIASFVKNLD